MGIAEEARTVSQALDITEPLAMKLNGWVRLWIVLSVCWLASVGYFAYDDISSPYTKKTFDVAKESVAKVRFGP